MDLNLSGRVALITGGSKGIGRSISLALAREGVNIAICARGNNHLERTAQEIRSLGGGECITVEADLRLAESGRKFIKAAADHYRRADILVCCANVLAESGGTLSSIKDDEWVSHMNLKFFSVVRCCREIVPLMQKEKWGRIVILGGMSVRLVRLLGMDAGPICAALTNFGKQLAAQVIRDGICVNTIHPDWTRTELLSEYLKRDSALRGMSLSKVEKVKAENLPLKRLLEPEEIASLVAFLCSESAGAITGQSIAVDGGVAMSVHY